MKIIAILLACVVPLLGYSAQTTTIVTPLLESYLELLNQYPTVLGPIGNASNGEIEIVRDPQHIRNIESKTGRFVGIVAQDKYWIWLNDAAKFPQGKEGVYGRILWVRSLSGTPGVAVMPVLPDGRIVLNLNYRHATRSWELELPRGMLEANESPIVGAIREVEEETGMTCEDVQFLGNVTPDSGLTNTVVPLYLGKVIKQQKNRQEDSEAILSNPVFTLKELKKGLIDGHIHMQINGQFRPVPLRDPFLTFALLQCYYRGILSE